MGGLFLFRVDAVVDLLVLVRRVRWFGSRSLYVCTCASLSGTSQQSEFLMARTNLNVNARRLERAPLQMTRDWLQY
jgi:hypothetical protein